MTVASSRRPQEVPLSLTDFFNGGSGGAQMTQAFSSVQNIPIRINNLGFYVQDEWRIKPNFSVTAALRLEHNSNPYCVTDCFATFAGGYDQALANEGDPYNTLIQTGRSQALYNLQGLRMAAARKLRMAAVRCERFGLTFEPRGPWRIRNLQRHVPGNHFGQHVGESAAL